jgi:hypothetical protein
LEEDKVIEETPKNQLEEKKNINECLEDKIVSQRKEVERKEELLKNHLKERYEDLNNIEV